MTKKGGIILAVIMLSGFAIHFSYLYGFDKGEISGKDKANKICEKVAKAPLKACYACAPSCVPAPIPEPTEE